MAFRKVPAIPDFPTIERKIFSSWFNGSTKLTTRRGGILAKYLKKNQRSAKKFRFLDGPITANNPMGVHHAWGRTYKDLFQRYKNMQGFRQRFQNGFDCQGLWVEVEVEKELGFKTKKDIERYGIGKFVEKCKERVFKYAKIQIEQSKRLGYFMDWGNDYYTLSDENNYTIWHFLKKCHENGWIYEGRDVVPWCSRCGTAISEHEIATEGYKELTHQTIYIKFPAFAKASAGKPVKREEGTYFLVWTTTPWTLPANTALAVGEDRPYVFVKSGGETYILAKERARASGIKGEVVKEVAGKELVGWEFEPLFSQFFVQQGIKHRVVAADFVSTEEGTGIVHIAPGSGQEDYQLSKELDLPVIESLDEEGKFLEGFGNYSRRSALEIGSEVIHDLEERGLVFKTQSYTHRYPVCWRCGTELIFRLVDEWYIAMDNLREPMMRITKTINWIPSFGLERELDWLKNMHDWLISKKRYWGLALPIYKCHSCGTSEVIGSKEELKKRAVSGWDKFEGHSPHRPWIDEVKIGCSRCGSSVSRIKDVGNPWLDAGIVPFSTVGYLSKKKYWQEWFPFDFITESFPGQFRNWFYSLLAMAAVLEDKAPFQNVLGHALVRDEKGVEMHKSAGNMIEFNEGAEKMGADVMRFMYALQDPATNINFGYGPAEVLRRRFFFILWNIYKFLIDNALADRWEPKKKVRNAKQKNILDKWIYSRLNGGLRNIIDNGLEKYDPREASILILIFIVKDLSQWYVRRIRGRIGPSVPDSEDKESAYYTLWDVLVTLSKILAPFTPFISEEIYRNLTGEDSVHLASWPEVDEKMIDRLLEEKMQHLREIVELGHSFRKTRGITLRQPLAKLTVSGFELLDKELTNVLADELNVKKVEFKKGNVLKVNFETDLTPELKAEGTARELVRAIQGLRKEESLRLTDKIKVSYPETPENKLAVALFSDLIRRETLAKGLIPGKTLKISLLQLLGRRRRPSNLEDTKGK